METAEDKLIARFFRPLATHPGALSLSDDAAVFAPPEGHETVLTTDAIVVGVHVMPDETPDAIARKALRVNLSDLAAKGAAPAAFLMSLALPKGLSDDWLVAFCEGLRSDSEHYGCSLIGGDTDRISGHPAITIFAIGTLPRGTMVKRGGAKPSDRLFVTGTIGDAALGLKLRRDPSLATQWSLSDAERDHLLSRYRLPQPRTAMADALRAYASAAMDISDGFAGDLAKLLRVSDVTADIAADAVPISPAASKALKADPALHETILAGGDDYEIIFSVPDEKVEAMQKAAAEAKVSVSALGHVGEGTQPMRLLDASSAVLTFARSAFSHF